MSHHESSTMMMNQNMDQAETILRQELTKLDITRKTLEHEADAIYLELTTPPGEGIEPMGIDTPLVDQDGYPRGDIDLYRTRTLRRRFRELKTDHKEIGKRIEQLLVQLATMKNPRKVEETKNETLSRKAPKPKPKYDPVTGKWVVMNWDGTVAGIPGGDKRSFQELDRQLSGLTGEDDVSSLGSSIVNSTRSVTTADHEPRPPPLRLPENGGEAMRAFARVDAVAANSPAQAAGLKEEDLIVSFGPLHSDNHDHLRAIAEYVLGVAADQKSIEICVLRRLEGSANNEDRWEALKLNLTPRPWSGRGFLGCHIVPYSA